jgi:hypothetical protein
LNLKLVRYQKMYSFLLQDVIFWYWCVCHLGWLFSSYLWCTKQIYCVLNTRRHIYLPKSFRTMARVGALLLRGVSKVLQWVLC